MLTREIIDEVVGRQLDDLKAAAIIATGATREELVAAVAWAEGESDVMGEGRRPLAGRIAEVYDILTVEDELDDEPPPAA